MAVVAPAIDCKVTVLPRKRCAVVDCRWGSYPSPRTSRTGTMLLTPNAINTATILSTRVHLRQSAFRSLITSSQQAL
jgi:hypothetical protein